MPDFPVRLQRVMQRVASLSRTSRIGLVGRTQQYEPGCSTAARLGRVIMRKSIIVCGCWRTNSQSERGRGDASSPMSLSK